MANKVLRIELDDGPECPMTEWDGMWTLHSFNRDSIHQCDPHEFVKDYDGETITPVNIGLRRKLSVGLAFWLDYYEHGQGMYSLTNEGPQCRWDTSSAAGILVWENKPGDMGAKNYEDRQQDARNFLETYNNWMNGNVYGFTLEDEDGEHLDSCWGFYDKDGLVETVNSLLQAGDCVKIEGQASDLIDSDDLPEGVEVVDEFEEKEEETPVMTGIFPILN